MTIQTFRSRATFPLLVLFGCVTPLMTLCGQDDTFLPPAPGGPIPANGTDDGVEVLSRGPVHEAFAEQYNQDPVPGLIVDREPPEPIDELPPETMPEGNNVQWVPGYFAWDEDLNDFVWISGLWRDFPPGQRWVPGYWNPTTDGRYQWVSGFWAPEQTSELDYLPYPPESLEQGPNIAAPGDNYYWVPGCWVYQNYDYRWRPGYWQVGYDDWVWFPDRYVWTPRGAIFCPGFYDYRVPYRGTLFAPVYFSGLNTWRLRNPYYTPGIVIGLSNLTLHLFVRPTYGHYYFGDYYGARYAGFGFQPWYRWNSYRYYDPLLVFYSHYHRRHSGINYVNRLASWHHYYDGHADHRPRRTFRAERDFASHHHNDPLAQQAVLTRSFDDQVRSDEFQRHFRHIDAAERDDQTRSSRHVRELTNLRRGSEHGGDRSNLASRSQSDHQHGNGPRVADSSPQQGGSQHGERRNSLALPQAEPHHSHDESGAPGRGSRSRPSNVPDVASLPDRPGHGGSQRRSVDTGVPSSQLQSSQHGHNQVDRGVDLLRNRGSNGNRSDQSSRQRSSDPRVQQTPLLAPQSNQTAPQSSAPPRGNSRSQSQSGGSHSNHSSGHQSSDPRAPQTPRATPQIQMPTPSQGSGRSQPRSSGSSSSRSHQPTPRSAPHTPSAGSSHGSSSHGRSPSTGSVLRSPSAGSSRSSHSSGHSSRSPSASSIRSVPSASASRSRQSSRSSSSAHRSTGASRSSGSSRSGGSSRSSRSSRSSGSSHRGGSRSGGSRSNRHNK